MKLEKLFSTVLSVSEVELSDAFGMGTAKNWSSLNHFKLISSLEEVYQVRFSTKEIKVMTSFGKVRKILDEKLNGVSAG